MSKTNRLLQLFAAGVFGGGFPTRMEVYGNGVLIANGDSTPSAGDHTDFETMQMDDGVSRTFTIENIGNADLVISDIVIPTGFTLTDPVAFPVTIAAGADDTFSIEANAASVDIFAGTVTIESNIANYSFAITANVYFEDTFTRANGAIGNGWEASTWSIVSGNALNAVALEAELLTDAGLEATYTAGKCDTLTATGSPTLAEETSAVHGGSKAQRFQAAAGGNALSWPVVAGVAGAWYQASIWRERVSGAAVDNRWQLNQSGAIPSSAEAGAGLTSATYIQDALSILSTSTANITVQGTSEQSGSPFPVVLIDDGSLKRITSSSLFALQDFGNADIILKMQPPNQWANYTDSTQIGLILRADTDTDPSNYIAVLVRRRQGSAFLLVTLFKRVGSTYTNILANQLITTVVDGAYLEARSSGNSVSIWYNDTQIGATQTISDAALVNNTIHGMISAGGNFVQSFLATAS